MDCNKDEAARAKSIAEAKLENKDFAGAKKFALKAQTLYPGLDGISQMLMTLDVYISAEKRINGLVNWYGVLGVSPSDEDETIKKQYRKLALMLHPDKNNSAGADGAFKLISEAWGLLSDKVKRSSYNLTTGHKGFQQKIPTNTSKPSPSNVHPTSTSRPTSSNVLPTNTTRPSPSNVHPGGPFTPPCGPPNRTGSSCTRPGGPPETSTERPFTKSAKRKAPAPKPQKKTAKAASAPPKPSPAPVESFWTICGQCSVRYEFHNEHLNRNLICPECKFEFVAVEIPRPVTKSKSPKPNPSVPVQQKQQQRPIIDNNISNSHAPSCVNNVQGKNVVPDAQNPGLGQAVPKISKHIQRPPPKSSTNVNSAAGPSVAVKVTILENKLKRAVRTESNTEMGGVKKAKLDSHNSGAGLKNYNTSNFKIHEGRNDNYDTVGNKDAKAPRGLVNLETRKLLMGKAREEISRKMNESSLAMPVDNNNKQKDIKAGKRQAGPADNVEKMRKSEKINDTGSADNVEKMRKPEKINGNGHKNANEDLSPEINSAVVMNVPDPDFFDFDQDRTENSFADNDVWAVYDDYDGMPRLYALIHKVISKSPFQLKISWLNSKTTTEFSPTLDWVGFGFYKTCGEFRVGKHKLCKCVNSFSQRVKWSKGLRGAILIFPQKGDVWALYRNWSPDWDTQTVDDVIYKYDMVVVLDEYDEKGLVSVAPLVKVAGYRTVFCPDFRKEAVMEIQREEMFRFSHMVPHHKLTSQEAPGAPVGCVELDPAATPLELLEIGAGSDVGTVLNESPGVEIKTCQGDVKEGAETIVASEV